MNSLRNTLPGDALTRITRARRAGAYRLDGGDSGDE